MNQRRRTPLLERFYQHYLIDQDSSAFVKKVSQHYTPGTLERLATSPRRETRRPSVLALGFTGDFGSNAVLGRALNDDDRGVRLIAENGIRSLWCRDGNESQRQLLGIVIRLNGSQQFDEAARRCTELLEEAPWYAEAWNQRAIAHYSRKLLSDSIRDCRQALEFNPYHFGAAAGMGQCYLQMGDHRSALEAFRRALRLNPNLEGVRANIAHLERVLKER